MEESPAETPGLKPTSPSSRIFAGLKAHASTGPIFPQSAKARGVCGDYGTVALQPRSG